MGCFACAAGCLTHETERVQMIFNWNGDTVWILERQEVDPGDNDDLLLSSSCRLLKIA